MLTAFVLIDCDPGRIPEVAERVANLTGVSECYSVAGDYDLIAIVRVRDHEQLADVIADGISKVNGVAKTKTLIAFRTYSKKELEQAFALGFED